LASCPVHFKIRVLDKPGPCTITFYNENLITLKTSYGWTDEESTHFSITKLARKGSMKIVQAPRVKLFHNDDLFVDEYAYIVVESPRFTTRGIRIAAHFGPFNDNDDIVVERLYTSKQEEPAQLKELSPPRVRLDEIVFAKPEESHSKKVSIVKINAEKGVMLKTNQRALAKLRAERTKTAAIDRQKMEEAARAKNISTVNKREIFRARREATIIAYVNAYNAAHRNERIVERLKSINKVRHAYKCLLKGIKERKYALHLIEYGRWAAIKMQCKLKRGLTKQFGFRLTYEQRIYKRSFFAMSCLGSTCMTVEGTQVFPMV
jgi:hypothetical protein